MRLRIQLKVNNLQIPFHYKHILQATIYNMLEVDELGSFYHDEGYSLKDKKYKLFVFSDLLGERFVVNKKYLYRESCEFFVDSLEENFIQILYNYLINNEYLYLCNQQVRIENIELFNTPVFTGEKELVIQTLSPVTAYTSKDGFFKYYKPSDKKFEELVINNILNKCIAYQYPIKSILFKIRKVEYEKEKYSKFKNTFYIAYHCKLHVSVNYETFKLLYETGLSAKGSCGFGMIKLSKKRNEKNNLSV